MPARGRFPKRTWNAMRNIANYLMPEDADESDSAFMNKVVDWEDSVEELAYMIKLAIDDNSPTGEKDDDLMCHLVLNAYITSWYIADLLDEFGESEELVQRTVASTCFDYPIFVLKTLEKAKREKEKLCQKEK